jgi:hypothetical protein
MNYQKYQDMFEKHLLSNVEVHAILEAVVRSEKPPALIEVCQTLFS